MKNFIFIQMLILLLYSTASSTTITAENCESNCTWVEVSTKTWVQTFSVEEVTSETNDQYTYRPVENDSKTVQKKGPTDSYICYVLLNGGSYGDYSVEPTSDSEYQTLYNAGRPVTECSFDYASERNSRGQVSRSSNPWIQTISSSTKIIEGGYWVESTEGYWECPPAPVPEPTTLLLFGTGLLGIAGISRRKRTQLHNSCKSSQ